MKYFSILAMIMPALFATSASATVIDSTQVTSYGSYVVQSQVTLNGDSEYEFGGMGQKTYPVFGFVYDFCLDPLDNAGGPRYLNVTSNLASVTARQQELMLAVVDQGLPLFQAAKAAYLALGTVTDARIQDPNNIPAWALSYEIADAMALDIWEIANETSGTYSLTSGSFSYTPGGNTYLAQRDQFANEFLADAVSGASVDTGKNRLLFVSEDPGQRLVSVQAVPEPATWALMLVGMGAIGFAMRRRQSVGVAYA